MYKMRYGAVIVGNTKEHIYSIIESINKQDILPESYYIVLDNTILPENIIDISEKLNVLGTRWKIKQPYDNDPLYTPGFFIDEYISTKTITEPVYLYASNPIENNTINSIKDILEKDESVILVKGSNFRMIPRKLHEYTRFDHIDEFLNTNELSKKVVSL